MVPLKLCLIDGNISKEIWTNTKYSSPLFCRPILIKFEKENVETTKAYQKDIESQIDYLTPTCLQIGDKSITVKHKIILTMIDEKVYIFKLSN